MTPSMVVVAMKVGEAEEGEEDKEAEADKVVEETKEAEAEDMKADKEAEETKEEEADKAAEDKSPVQAFPTQLSPQNLPRVPSSKVIRFLKSYARSQIFSSTPNYIIKDDIRHITISSWISLSSPVLLLVPSAVAEETTSKEVKKEEESEESNQFGGPGRPCRLGCCGGFLHGRCRRCCGIRNANEASQFTQAQAKAQTENVEVADTNYGGGGWGGHGGYGGGGWGGGRGGGGWGGGWVGANGGGYGGGGWGGGRGGGCRFGCCGYGGGYRGGCRYCCASAAEALNFVQNEAKP
ncbi:hypothetical protein RHMOL_Rhmol06G0239900 [Rhododendron molle]|uniref:Uncharacterized protein n=1 Tax=Rhododendron molle TaxID=49168 RepID=A0ACC0NFZ6_RHOML|nr:hypothetical protein RHMOL_Rhmol06G0239900 [Rhododendron molle]